MTGDLTKGISDDRIVERFKAYEVISSLKVLYDLLVDLLC